MSFIDQTVALFEPLGNLSATMSTSWTASSNSIMNYTFQPEHILLLLTIIVLETVLSVDNAAILAAMARHPGLTDEQRRKVLIYGLWGGYIMRFVAILFAGLLIAVPLFRFVGGLYLFQLGARALWNYFVVKTDSDHDGETDSGDRSASGWAIRLFGSFWGVVVSVELVDLAFAVDQVVAQVAFTNEFVLIIIGCFIGILMLRVAAMFMMRVMAWFPQLEQIAYGVVTYIGLKLMLEVYDVVHISKGASATITILAFAIPISYKLIKERMAPKIDADRA